MLLERFSWEATLAIAFASSKATRTIYSRAACIRRRSLCSPFPSFFRHPAYTGWFYFSIGTQVLLNNPLCTLAYAAASWYFFYMRIPYEERTLLHFFPEYREYRERTHVLIPFIPKVESFPLCSNTFPLFMRLLVVFVKSDHF